MPTKSYIAPETATVWTDSGGDKLLDLGNLSGGGGGIAVGAYLDLGSGSRTNWYEVEMKIDGFASSPAVGDKVDIMFAQSNATTGFDGQLTADPTASTQGSISSVQQLENLTKVLLLRAVSTTAGDVIQGRAIVKFTGRFVAPVVINRSVGAALKGTSDSHTVTLTPIPQEGQ